MELKRKCVKYKIQKQSNKKQGKDVERERERDRERISEAIDYFAKVCGILKKVMMEYTFLKHNGKHLYAVIVISVVCIFVFQT